MARVGYRAAKYYSYSNARVKAMHSKLLSKTLISEIARIDALETIVAKLLQTDYRDYIEQFGGTSLRSELIDYALSRSLADSAKKLIMITPKELKDITIKLVSRWDVHNLKLIFHAKASGKSFESISQYLVESPYLGSNVIREALAQSNVEEAANYLMKRTPYRKIIESGVESYKKTANITEANAAMDKAFFELLGRTMERLNKISYESAKVVGLDIEMRNVLTLIRARRYGMQSQKLEELLIDGGITQTRELLRIYESAKDVKGVIDGVRSFDLKNAFASYESDRGKQVLVFEIAMRNAMFREVQALLRHTVLSFGVIVGYFYLKEIEVFTLRILMKGKGYGLGKDEITQMIGWQA